MTRRLLLAALVFATACHSAPMAPDCVRDPKVPADTATVLYNGQRIYLNSCATLPPR